MRVELGRYDGVATSDPPETEILTSILDWKETIKKLLRSEIVYSLIKIIMFEGFLLKKVKSTG